MRTTIEKRIEQLYDKGLNAGFKMGLNLGQLLQRLQIAELMLAKKEPLQKIKRYTGVSDKAIRKIKTSLRKNRRRG
jgi:biotin operon repressor